MTRAKPRPDRSRFSIKSLIPKRRASWIGAAVIALLSGIAAEAQRAGPWSGGQNPSSRQNRTYEAGKFDYYVLALSWSPSYCARSQSARDDQQCDRRDGKRFAFVLHGLWPQFERGWPQDCQTGDRGFVPRPVANRKHGTCSGLGIDGYFDLARKLHDKVKIPERYRHVSDPRLTVAPDAVISEFVAANPGLTRDMIVVKCGGPGNRMEEVRVCFDRAGAFRGCGRNEDQRKACAAPRMYVPPVRG
jgi:ribonuclease T2